MLIYKKFKVFILFAMVLIFLTAISANIIADNKFASNDLGDFYINAQNVLYFKGTLNGQTYTNYVPLTGANNATGIDSSFMEGATKIYASGDTFSVIDDKGNLFGYGANLDQLYGTSGSNSTYSYLGGSNSNKIVNVSLTTHGSAIRAEDGSVSVRKANLNDDNTYSGAAQIYASYTSPLVTEEGTFNSHFDVKVFRDGTAFIPVVSDDVNNTDFIKSYSPNVLQTRSEWNDPTRIHFNYDHKNAGIEHGAGYLSYDGFTLNGEDYVVMHIKDPYQGPKVANVPMSGVVMIAKGGPGEYRNWEPYNSRSVSKVSVNDGIITMIYEDGEILQSASDDPFSFDTKFKPTGKLETEADWGAGGTHMVKDPDGTIYFTRGNEGGHNIMKIDTDGTVSKITDFTKPIGGIALSPSGELVVSTEIGILEVLFPWGWLVKHDSMNEASSDALLQYSAGGDVKFDNDGALYVSPAGNQSPVYKWSPGEDVVELTPGNSAWGGGGDMDFDPIDGHLWRNANHGMLLQKIDKDTGAILKSIDLYSIPHPFGSDFADYLDPVTGLAVDDSGKIHFVNQRGQYGVLDPDTLAITDMDMHRDGSGRDGSINTFIDYYKDGNKTVPAYNNAGSDTYGPELKAPMDILLEDDGTVLILQGSNTVGSLRRLTPTSLITQSLPENLDLDNISEIAIDKDGDLMFYNNNDIYSLSSQSSAFSLAKAVNPLYDDNGFDVTGLHRDTGTPFDSTGLTQDRSAYDSNGFNINGLDTQGADVTGFDSAGYNHITDSYFGLNNLTSQGEAYGSDGRNSQGYDTAGFSITGTHSNGSMYNDSGFDQHGYDSNGVSADGLNVRNGELAKDFNLLHSIERDSFFKTLVESSKITKSGDTKLGRFYLRNNTRDGFELSIDSAEGGVLQPTGLSITRGDGEVPIPYSLYIVKEGDIGVGVDEDYEFTSSDLASAAGNRAALDASGIIGVSILKVAGGGSAASSATDAKFELFVNIVDESNIMEMAGTYTDTLTLTYMDK